MKKRIFSVLICMIVVFSSFSFTANAALGKTILSIGDSISTGYGLKEPEKEGFAYNLGNEDDTHINMAVNGNTAAGIISQLQDKNNSKYISTEVIESADVITITCGGNDLMAVLYSKIAQKWNENHPNETISQDNITNLAGEHAVEFVTIVSEILDKSGDEYLLNDPVFVQALGEYKEKLVGITTYLKSVNHDVTIIVATQYNPYAEFKGGFLTNRIYQGIEDGVTELNTVIKSSAEEGRYIVSEVKKAFDEYKGTEDLYNADKDISKKNLDFHPSAAGHAVLAESFNKTLNDIFFKYEVVHCFENLDGTFSEESEKFEGVLGETVKAQYAQKEGFVPMEGAEGEKTEGIITADEKLVLKLYYSRNSYKVSWVSGGEANVVTYKYEEKVESIESPLKEGYIFTGWDKEIPQTMPPHDVVITATWRASDSVTPDVSSPVSSSVDESETENGVMIIVFVVLAVAVVVLFIGKKAKESGKNSDQSEKGSDE